MDAYPETYKFPVRKGVALAVGSLVLASVTKGHLAHQQVQKHTGKRNELLLDLTGETWRSVNSGNKLASSVTGKDPRIKNKTGNYTHTRHCARAGRLLIGRNTQEITLNYFVGKGLSVSQSAGIDGNYGQESGWNQYDPNGYLAQWGGGRLAALESFAQRRGKSASNLKVQLDYTWLELTNGPGAGEDDRSVLKDLKATHTVADAAVVFSNGYERPSDPQLQNRISYAEQILHQYGHLACQSYSVRSSSIANVPQKTIVG